MSSADDLPKITAALLACGYDEITIGKIVGGNLQRVMEQVEAMAAASKALDKQAD